MAVGHGTKIATKASKVVGRIDPRAMQASAGSDERQERVGICLLQGANYDALTNSSTEDRRPRSRLEPPNGV
jgi:hypothetical protein